MKPTSSSLDKLWAVLTLGAGCLYIASLAKAPPQPVPPVPTPQTIYTPPIAAASSDALNAVPTLRMPDGFRAALFAAEPMLANPVGFWFDGPNRCYVAETFRQETKGVPDNRNHNEWLLDDLRSMNLDDRREMYLKHHPQYAVEWTQHHERIRLVLDTDGNGIADTSHVYADGFNDLLDGTGASVLFHEGAVYFTCIPNVSRLVDLDGDYRADHREDLFRGFGVRIALRGHDLHGLRIGPDGRLWFSIGDRGYNVLTREGRQLVDPQSGAVFRCELDGSNLEVFATGLRNPQDLAFDEYGNLFTGDNNGDGGDSARFVYVVEGGDTGWRMNYQYIDERGPWVREKWAWPADQNQAAFLIPPIALCASGPSGLVFEPGTTLPDPWRRNFLLCDFTGGSSSSGIHGVKLEPDGAGFKLTRDEWLLRGLLATDCEITDDGTVAVADWVQGWEGVGKGRIYKIRHEETWNSQPARETRRILREGFKFRPISELCSFLSHDDQRIRLRAQWTLAEKSGPVVEHLTRVAVDTSSALLARIHALWALDQRFRRGETTIRETVLHLTTDLVPEIRAQAARLIGEFRHPEGAKALRLLLSDPEPRVVYFALLSLGKLGNTSDIQFVLDILATNNNRDLFLRHAAVFALEQLAHGSPELLKAAADDSRASVRMGVLLAWRRLRVTSLTQFLTDPRADLAAEAARAIWDRPLPAAFDLLADQADAGHHHTDAFLKRALAAAEARGQEKDARALVSALINPDRSRDLRLFVIQALVRWGEDQITEFVWRDVRPRAGHEPSLIVRELETRGFEVLKTTDPVIAARVLRLLGHFKLQSWIPGAVDLASAESSPVDVRIAAIDALEKADPSRLAAMTPALIRSTAPKVRARAALALVTITPDKALSTLTQLLETGTIAEQQAALDGLGRIRNPEAIKTLELWMNRLRQNEVPPALMLELLSAIQRQIKAGSVELKTVADNYDASIKDADLVSRRKECLEGGDRTQGERIFRESKAACLRCHSLDGSKPEQAGPDLQGLGKTRTRHHILESLVDPSRQITAGFARELITTLDGEILDVRVLAERDNELEIELVRDGKLTHSILQRSAVAERRPGRSAMPDDVVKDMTSADLRDLVEFLATLESISQPNH